jgi:hypothetical protein
MLRNLRDVHITPLKLWGNIAAVFLAVIAGTAFTNGELLCGGLFTTMAVLARYVAMMF